MQVANLTVFGVPILSAVSKYYFCLVVVCVVALMCKNLVRGAVGREWMAVRDMDVAAEVIGIRPVFAKLSAFAVSSFVVGLAGAMWAFVYLGAWEPSAFSIDQSLRLLFMVIIGGLGTIMGNFLGAAFIVLLPLVLTHAAGLVASLFGVAHSTEVIAHVETVVFGGLIVFFLAVEPHGLARLLSMAREKLRIWPYPH